MLTPLDVHYIVGFLSLASGPENVEVELGDFVYDEASRTRRDVDVTITCRNTDGSRTAFKGLEVKAHKRRLGSEHVEQLAQKLADMPAITSKAIVSASGFSKPAIRKAKHHGVDLYELKDWDPATGYEYFRAETIPAAREAYGWVGNLRVRVNPHRQHTADERLILNTDPEMVFENPPELKYKLNAWLADLGKLAAKEAASRAGPAEREGRHQNAAAITVQFTDKAFAVKDAHRVPITSVAFSGILERRVEQLSSVMKGLYKLGSVQPIAGCAISDFGGEFGLIALIISDRRTIELAKVPIANRNRHKIIGQHLRRSPESADTGDSATV